MRCEIRAGLTIVCARLKRYLLHSEFEEPSSLSASCAKDNVFAVVMGRSLCHRVGQRRNDVMQLRSYGLCAAPAAWRCTASLRTAEVLHPFREAPRDQRQTKAIFLSPPGTASSPPRGVNQLFTPQCTEAAAARCNSTRFVALSRGAQRAARRVNSSATPREKWRVQCCHFRDEMRNHPRASRLCNKCPNTSSQRCCFYPGKRGKGV